MTFDPIECTQSGLYIRVPLALLERPGVTADDAMTYAYLAFCTRGPFGDGHATCWPGIKRIAKDLHLSQKTSQRRLDRLSDLGLVARDHTPNAKGKPTVITLCPWRPAASCDLGSSATSGQICPEDSSDCDLRSTLTETCGHSCPKPEDTGDLTLSNEEETKKRTKKETKRDSARSVSPSNGSNKRDIAALEERYGEALAREARDACALNRRNGQMSDSCWLRTLRKLNAFRQEACVYAMREFVDKHADGSKREEYLIAIARNAERAQRTGQQPRQMKTMSAVSKTHTTEEDFDWTAKPN